MFNNCTVIYYTSSTDGSHRTDMSMVPDNATWSNSGTNSNSR